MSNHYTLADLKAELDKQYAPLVIDLGSGEVTLRSLLRVPEAARKRVFALMDELDIDKDAEDVSGEEADKTLETAREILVLVTADGKGKDLTEAIGDDLALVMNIFELWMEATQPGEAEASPKSSKTTASA